MFGTPLIKGGIQSNQVPCYGYDRERLVLPAEQMSAMHFLIEKESPLLEQCPSHPWRDNRLDTRFYAIGEVSLFDLQE